MGLFGKLFGKKEHDVQKPQTLSPPTPAPTPRAAPAPVDQVIRVPCNQCNGHYKVRDGKYGMFAGCSNYPTCKSTLKLPDLVLKYLEIYGLNIYRWDKECYKCGKKTPVYSYYLDYDLAELDEIFSMGGPTVGLGDLSYIDELLSKQIPAIQMRYSRTTNSKYMANTCEHCGALQGRNYVVDDPHEIIGELWHDRGMEKYLYRHLEIENTAPLAKDIRQLYLQGE